MFYLARPANRITRRILLAALVVGLVLPFAAFMADDNRDAISSSVFLSSTQWAAIASLPAALVVWLIHPLMTLHSIAQRKRRRKDASLLFWRAGLATAFLLIPLAAATVFLDDNSWPILFGWLAVWGWAGMILHGMLTRIVPFLVWFHRITPLIGKTRVPSVRGLLSQRRIKTGFFIHLVSVLLGAAAIVSQAEFLVRMTGAILIATGISLGSSLIHVLGRSWRQQN